MVESLEECNKLLEAGVDVKIMREVRYYARIGDIQYILANDWDTSEVESKLWQKSTKIEVETTEGK